MDFDGYTYEPAHWVMRLAAREVEQHPNDTLGSLFDRFVSSEAATREMTAFAFRETDPDEATRCFLNQELYMCCLELGSNRRLDTIASASAIGPYAEQEEALALNDVFYEP